MNILIDIGHPGHVHLFKNLYFELIKRNHKVIVTVKQLPVATKLLNFYNIPFINIGEKKDTIRGKIAEQFKFNFKIWRIINNEQIDVGIGTSFSIAQLSKLTKMKSIILDDDDDEVEPFFVKFVHPFCDYLLSPDVLKGKRKRKNTVYYPGLHELAYLHPDLFSPDENVLFELGLQRNEPFFVLRFNAFKAHHDTNVKGLSLKQKLHLIHTLSPHGKVFVTAERELEPELNDYQLILSPEKIHSLIFFATMFIGDSQTMTSEAAVLGTPAIRCNTLAGKISYLDEEEKKYGLAFSYTPGEFDVMIKKIVSLTKISGLKLKWKQKREKFLKDKINPAPFYLWFIENIDKVKETAFDDNFFLRFAK